MVPCKVHRHINISNHISYKIQIQLFYILYVKSKKEQKRDRTRVSSFQFKYLIFVCMCIFSTHKTWKLVETYAVMTSWLVQTEYCKCISQHIVYRTSDSEFAKPILPYNSVFHIVHVLIPLRRKN